MSSDRRHPQNILTAALAYATERGWDVFPAVPEEKKSHKAAEHSNGKKWGKTKDPAEIENDWKKWPDANVGIPTGKDNGFFVIEADTKEGHKVDGLASIEELEKQHGKLPDTLMAESPSGSIHRYFKYPTNGIEIKNSASKIAPGVDIRGEGGMVIAPPSIKGGGVYKWLNDLEIAKAPEWLIAAAVEASRKGKGAGKPTVVDTERLRAALKVIPNDDLGWEEWNNVGMAIYAARGGDNDGLLLFHEWSKKSKKYDHDTTDAKWDALHKTPPTSIGAGTIFFLADQADPNWQRGIQDDIEINRLAMLSMIEYEKQRKEAAKALGITRLSILDRLVESRRKELGLDQRDDNKQGRAISINVPEPWPDPVDGAKLLDEIGTAIRKHVVFSDASKDTCALWVVHTYMVERFFISPRLSIISQAPRCGKTTLLDTVAPLACRSLSTAGVTPAVVFRVVEMCKPCLLIDEGDTFIGGNEELRGILNSGHRKGGQVLRSVGDDHEPRAFSTYGACAIALIKSLPETLQDRSIRIDLPRRLKTEKIAPFRLDRVSHLEELARKVARWAADNADRVEAIDPAMPPDIFNREADNWRPLLAIADAVGGEWPNRARKAAGAIHIVSGGETGQLEALISDIKINVKGLTQIPSHDLVELLTGMEGHPWAEMGKMRKPLTQNRLARMLKPLGVAPTKIWVKDQGGSDKSLQGYVVSLFDDLFARFCPDDEPPPSPGDEA